MLRIIFLVVKCCQMETFFLHTSDSRIYSANWSVPSSIKARNCQLLLYRPGLIGDGWTVLIFGPTIVGRFYRRTHDWQTACNYVNGIVGRSVFRLNDSETVINFVHLLYYVVSMATLFSNPQFE